MRKKTKEMRFSELMKNYENKLFISIKTNYLMNMY